MESVEADRRRYQRFRVEPMVVQLHPRERGAGILRDVSLGGMFLLSRDHPPMGTEMDLSFEEEPLEGYRLRGRVSRHEHGRLRGFAISFPIPRPRILRAFYHGDVGNN